MEATLSKYILQIMWQNNWILDLMVPTFSDWQISQTFPVFFFHFPVFFSVLFSEFNKYTQTTKAEKKINIA